MHAVYEFRHDANYLYKWSTTQSSFMGCKKRKKKREKNYISQINDILGLEMKC